jgi:hypothetical protein
MAADSAPLPPIADSGKDTRAPQLADGDVKPADMVKLFTELCKYKHDMPGRAYVQAAACVGRLVVKLGSAFSMASSDIQEVRQKETQNLPYLYCSKMFDRRKLMPLRCASTSWSLALMKLAI